MKLKALLLGLFTAGFAVSIAVAGSPAAIEKGKPGTGATSPGTTTHATSTGEHQGDPKGKHHGQADRCKPARKLELHGEFVAAGAGGFAMKVKKGNHGAQAFVGKQATVVVDAKTRFHGKKHALADLVAGDRLAVQGYACKADAVAGSLLARKVSVKGGTSEATEDEARKDDTHDDDDKNEADDGDEDDPTTTGP